MTFYLVNFHLSCISGHYCTDIFRWIKKIHWCNGNGIFEFKFSMGKNSKLIQVCGEHL